MAANDEAIPIIAGRNDVIINTLNVVIAGPIILITFINFAPAPLTEALIPITISVAINT